MLFTDIRNTPFQKKVPSQGYQCLLFFHIFKLNIQRSSNNHILKTSLTLQFLFPLVGKGHHPNASMGWMCSWFQNQALWIKTCTYYVTSKATQVTHKSDDKAVCMLVVFLLINRNIIAYDDDNHSPAKRKKSKL